MNTDRAQLLADVAYGLAILTGTGSIFYFTGESFAGVTLGVGLLVGYIIHFAWRMVLFDYITGTEQLESDVEDVRNEVESIADDVEAVQEHFSDE